MHVVYLVLSQNNTATNVACTQIAVSEDENSQNTCQNSGYQVTCKTKRTYMRQKLLNHLQKAATQYKLSTTYGELLKAQHVLLMFYISQKQESVPCLYGAVKPAEVAKGRNRLEKLLQMILKCYYFPRLECFLSNQQGFI